VRSLSKDQDAKDQVGSLLPTGITHIPVGGCRRMIGIFRGSTLATGTVSGNDERIGIFRGGSVTIVRS
jgi:hypothetical protein